MPRPTCLAVRPVALSALLPWLLAPPALARVQENVRTMDGPGVETKYLTPNGRDMWKIQVPEGEMLVVHVSTREFDPVLRLLAPDDTELLEVDDEGSESRFARRLEEGGEYRIEVHGFELRGGGNYQLTVQRFAAPPLELEREAVVVLDRDGRAHRRLDGAVDEILVPRVEGPAPTIACLDPKGAPVADWMQTFRVEHAGEHVLVFQGVPRARLRVLVRRARRAAAGEGAALEGELAPGELHVWEMAHEELDFRAVELVRGGEVYTRIVRAGATDERDLLSPRGFELRHLPVQSKGLVQRYATVYGRADRYELQVLSRAASPRHYALTVADPTRSIEPGASGAEVLPVGGAHFHGFAATAGQLFTVRLGSAAFDAHLRLFDETGAELASDDDGGEGLDSHLSFLVQEPGLYRLQVSSRGDGGGGAYELRLEELEVPVLEPGVAQTVQLGAGARTYLRFDGRAGRTVLLSARSSECDPRLEVLGPDGVQLGADDDGGVEHDSLLALRPTASGPHTFWVTASGEGEVELRLIELD